jgi:hypothetical protein
MADIPVTARALKDWRDELGLDRLRANLISGDLEAGWYDHTTGEYHLILHAHWAGKVAGKDALEHALKWGWPIGGMFSPNVRVCAIYAWQPVHANDQRVAETVQEKGGDNGTSPERRFTPPGPAQKKVIEKLRKNYPPDGIAPEGTSVSDMCRETGLDPARDWHTVDRAVRYLMEHLRRLKR